MSFFKKVFGGGGGSSSSSSGGQPAKETSTSASAWETGQLKDLPADCKKFCRACDISPAKAEEHFDVLLNVLLFEMKRQTDVMEVLSELARQHLRAKKVRDQALRAEANVGLSIYGPIKTSPRRTSHDGRVSFEETPETATSANQPPVAASPSSGNVGDKPDSPTATVEKKHKKKKKKKDKTKSETDGPQGTSDDDDDDKNNNNNGDSGVAASAATSEGETTEKNEGDEKKHKKHGKKHGKKHSKKHSKQPKGADDGAAKESPTEVEPPKDHADENKVTDLATAVPTRKNPTRAERQKEMRAKLEAIFTDANPDAQYSNKTRIGKGGFGDVYTAKDVRTGTIVALKGMRKTLDEDLEMMANEIIALSEFKHPNIVSFVGAYRWHDRITIVMEYCDGGSLRQVFDEISLAEGDIIFIAREILQAVAFLHSSNRMHRDLKADNVLLNLNGHVKLADLGLSADANVGDKAEGKTQMAGSRNWMAPEIIRRQPYGTKADIWSFGALVYEMAHGTPPYWDLKPAKAMFQLATEGAPPVKNPGQWSSSMKALLKLTFEMNADARPSADELSKHPWFSRKCSRESLINTIGVVFLGNGLRMNGF